MRAVASRNRVSLASKFTVWFSQCAAALRHFWQEVFESLAVAIDRYYFRVLFHSSTAASSLARLLPCSATSPTA